jgi:hypothetical protein
MGTFFDYYDAGSGDLGPDQLDQSYDLLSSLNTQALAIYRGDPLVLTTVDGGVPRLRKVIQDDIDDLWIDTNTLGFMGISPQNVATDANGFATTIPQVVAVYANVANNYNIPSLAQFGPSNLATGRLRSSVISVKNVIGGSLWETTAITDALIGTMVGMLISTISGQPPTFFWSTAATTKIARIVAIDDQAPLFNTTATANVQDTTHYPRCPIGVQVLAAYDQAQANGNYTD